MDKDVLHGRSIKYSITFLFKLNKRDTRQLEGYILSCYHHILVVHLEGFRCVTDKSSLSCELELGDMRYKCNNMQ